MRTAISVRLPKNLPGQLDSIAKETERPRSFIIQKAQESYNPEIEERPIYDDVFTTAQRQVLPIAISESTPAVDPSDLTLYSQFVFLRDDGCAYRRQGIAGPVPLYRLVIGVRPEFLWHVVGLLAGLSCLDSGPRCRRPEHQCAASVNAELLVQLTPEMQALIANAGMPI
jgi:predicted DNA-binding protein